MTLASKGALCAKMGTCFLPMNFESPATASESVGAPSSIASVMPVISVTLRGTCPEGFTSDS